MRALWFWVGAAGMVAGTIPALYRLVTEAGYRRYYAVLTPITAIAAVTYVVMALGIGEVSGPRAAVLVPRYVDWVLTTALIVGFLGMLAEVRPPVYVGLLGTDLLVIGFGILAALISAPWSWVAFGAGTLVYPALLALLVWYVPSRTDVSGRRLALFTKLRNLTVVLWTVYPVVWILSPVGIGLLDPSTEALVVTYLDFITKTGFVVIAANAAAAIRSGDDATDPDRGTRGSVVDDRQERDPELLDDERDPALTADD